MVVWVMDNGAVQKVKSSLRTKNHKHRYINVSNTLMGASISRKNDLLDTPMPSIWFSLHPLIDFSNMRIILKNFIPLT
jgi:hypothetical protein